MIKISGLTKTFPGGARALAGIDLEVRQGEILALLGPNGAGKTTAIRVLTTLSGFDDGKVVVAGHDVDVEPELVRQAIGYVAQDTGVDYFLTGRENLTLQGRLYRMTSADIAGRIRELSEYFGIAGALDKLVSTYSGGMRRKLDIATALIHRPKVVFLDEPTLGLDAPSRQSLWQYIRRVNEDLGLTILLTTHYLDEADRLAHRVAIIDGGQIKVIDTPEALKDTIKGDAVVLEVEDANKHHAALQDALKKLPEVQEVRVDGPRLHVYVAHGAAMIARIVDAAHACHAEIKNISLARPTLDDVFIRYTGASMTRVKDEGNENAWWQQWAGKGGGGKWAKQWQEQQENPAEENTGGSWPNQGQWTEEEMKQWWAGGGAQTTNAETATPVQAEGAAWPQGDWSQGGARGDQKKPAGKQ